MIDCLYEPFKRWSASGSVYIVSDTHLGEPEEINGYKEKIKRIVHKGDTLVHLGDIGDPSFFKDIKAHKVLIKGNHDSGSQRYKDYFDEIYSGPLVISDKIILSHELVSVFRQIKDAPAQVMYCIHGHDHANAGYEDNYHLNAIGTVTSLGALVKEGKFSKIQDVHRITIDNASLRKKTKK